jgi:formate hydrogenlyase subunit 3/multisubunit Na+/H+ antiporter MnhD subunit
MLFYVFFEATLIPMYLIIGIWGGPNKIYAAFKFFLYTLLGSLLMLVALIFLYTKSGGSFDILPPGTSCRWAARRRPVVLCLLCGLCRQGADVAGAHLVARRARRGAHRWLGVLAAIMLKLGPMVSCAFRCRSHPMPRASGPG